MASFTVYSARARLIRDGFLFSGEPENLFNYAREAWRSAPPPVPVGRRLRVRAGCKRRPETNALPATRAVPAPPFPGYSALQADCPVMTGPAAQQIGSVVIGSEAEGCVELSHRVRDAVNTRIHRGQRKMCVCPFLRACDGGFELRRGGFQRETFRAYSRRGDDTNDSGNHGR